MKSRDEDVGGFIERWQIFVEMPVMIGGRGREGEGQGELASYGRRGKKELKLSRGREYRESVMSRVMICICLHVGLLGL